MNSPAPAPGIPAPGLFPRLFFSAGDLPALRTKVNHPDCARVWSRLLEACRKRLEPEPDKLYTWHIRPTQLAFAYLITGERAFAEKAIELAMGYAEKERFFESRPGARSPSVGLATGGAVKEMALTYDWLHDLLTSGQRDRIRRSIHDKGFLLNQRDFDAKVPASEWYTCNGINVINGPMLMAALLFEGDPECSFDTRSAFDLALLQTRRAIDAHCQDGGYPEGPLYWNYGLRHMLLGVEALRRLKGVDLHDEPFLRNTGDYVLHCVLPWVTQVANPADSGQFTKLWPPIARFASRQRREDWQWLARRMITHDWQLDGEAIEYSVFFMLWYDPALPSAPPPPERAVHLFSGLQLLSYRSDWSERAVNALWLSGPSNCHHNQLHLNSFTVNAFGQRLLIETGCFDYGNYMDYRRLTPGHNTLLVDGESQVITTDESIFCRRIRAGMWGTVYGEFRCLREEADAVIATGAVVNAYPALRAFDRTLAFVDKRFFFVHDFIELKKSPPAELTWHFHSAGTAELADGNAVFGNGEARLLLRPLTTLGLRGSLGHDHVEMDAPKGRPNPPYWILKAECGTPMCDLFMLLVPFEAGESSTSPPATPPETTLRREGDRVLFGVGEAMWAYDLKRRGLERIGPA
ncbi:MAG: heparinase II/III family protein [Planctomycetota bacterium]|nr:heparinase II/III family protein [Planctomycetota bacterium]